MVIVFKKEDNATPSIEVNSMKITSVNHLSLEDHTLGLHWKTSFGSQSKPHLKVWRPIPGVYYHSCTSLLRLTGAGQMILKSLPLARLQNMIINANHSGLFNITRKFPDTYF
ncbi:hypothetical protein MAR_021355 [Mya arenaria]|uniref:Uncharacterized protein n=1 Tax=Mya arenaria TaxID=6604 RepID=A0ABY7EBE0_MYAAR|nr:hypothetical protein MAR_021355 [Mya arenaria]